jgi:GST-like protein
VIELYTWATPNGTKPAIMLEETGVPYTAHLVDITKGEQFARDFLAISPNNKIPALVDEEAGQPRRVLFESGAVLIYLAEKTGQLLAASGAARDAALEWLLWASSGVGPTFGQFWYYVGEDHDGTSPRQRFTAEAWRLVEVLEKRLNAVPFLAGDYSIADISAFTWLHAVLPTLQAHGSRSIPNVEAWLRNIQDRPAVRRGLRAPKQRVHAQR